jgi:hypothetical protein
VRAVTKLLREPLLHFLLLGAAIFAAYGLMPDRNGDRPDKIVISQGQIAAMELGFVRTWHRPPTAAEIEGLIRERVREEVFYREALALHLDKDDIIVRRRLRQKLEFIADDVATQVQPTDEELTAYLKAHPDRFGVARRWSFRHVYLDPAKHGEATARDAAKLLDTLNRAGDKADVAELGDPFLLDRTFEALPTREVAKLFGEKFAAQLATLDLGRWQGPIESGYGVHLVFIGNRTEGKLPDLEEVRGAVSREWANARRTEANEKFYQSLLGRYAVVVERPVADASATDTSHAPAGGTK